MTQLISLQSLGRNRDTPRLWLESQRLSSLGFPPGTPLQVEQRTESLTLRAGILAENHVSSRAAAGGRRPIIDLENQSLRSPTLHRNFTHLSVGIACRPSSRLDNCSKEFEML